MEIKTTFSPAEDGINPTMVPRKTLYTGAKIPSVGLGTFGSDSVSAVEIANAVIEAAELGYRHFDCASVYGNEKEIGLAFQTILKGGISRDEIWVTSKVWNDMHDRVIESCEQTLKDLQLDYLDLYLVHWPFPNYHPPGCSVDSRSPDAKPFILENFMKTWKQMEELVDRGLVKQIGTSNMTIPKLKGLLQECRIKPAANEMELHPHFQQPDLFDYVIDQGIQPIGFSPIGSPNRPERDRTSSDTVDIEDPVVKKIAEAHKIHPVSVCLKWAVQHGQVPIPFSTKRRNILSNLKTVVEDPLNDDEMAELSRIDKDCRLIKGQVFLWKDNQTWEDLWDLNGEITPP